MTEISTESLISFGELLKYLRRRVGLKQQELGQTVGYSAGHVARLEASQRAPDVLAVKTLFIQALSLEHEPELAARLIELAERAHEAVHPEPKTDVACLPTNLPAPLTSFVGRGQDMAEVIRLLGATRLLTLTGAGGCGKTRLALEVGARCALAVASVAADAQDALAFADGIWLAELAPLSDPALVATTVAGAFDLRPAMRPVLATLIDHLMEKQLLLILDNCEHVIAACAELAEAVLYACPGVRLLATSREGLNIPGETQWRVPSLALGYSEQLFIERAQAVQPGLVLAEERRSSVTQICERLDGIPLAIELAAARLQAFTVEQIAAHLDDRFSLLTGGSRTALPRHRTLRALVDWSYVLLAEEERVLLRQLSVFAGGWTLEAAQAVCSGAMTLELLAQLVNKSLVMLEDVNATGPRYRMLETVRQYADEKLRQAGEGEYERARQRHVAYYADLLEQAGPHWKKPEQKAWLDSLETELDNLRTALEWTARSPQAPVTVRLFSGMWPFWQTSGYNIEGMAWLERTYPPGAQVDARTRLSALSWMADLTSRNYDFRRCLEFSIAAEKLAVELKDPQLIWAARNDLAYIMADPVEALAMQREMAQLGQQAGNKRWEVFARLLLGRRLRVEGDYAGAALELEQSLALTAESQYLSIFYYILGQKGMLAFVQGDYAGARALFKESCDHLRQIGDDYYEAEFLTELAGTAAYQADYTAAMAALERATAYHYRMGNVVLTAQCLGIYAHIAYDHGQWEQAVRLLGAASAVWQDYPPEFLWAEPLLHLEYNRLPALLRAELGPARYDLAWAAGQRMTLLQAINAARGLSGI